MKLTLQIFGKEMSVALNEPAPKESDHKCPTREEDFAAWKARSSSGTASFGFAPKSQDFVNTRHSRAGRWTV